MDLAIASRCPIVTVLALTACIVMPLPVARAAALPATVAGAPPGVVISEFLAGPSTDWNGSGAFSSRDDEWVEVFNAGATPVDLASFFLTDGDSIPRYAFAGTLAPGERRVVFGSDAYDWERATGHPAFGLSLANGGDAVMLWEIAGPDTVVADAYTYRSHEGASDRAVGRLSDFGAWALFDGLNPYNGTIAPFGTGCAPSPNAENGCGATETRRSTWGRLKTIYR